MLQCYLDDSGTSDSPVVTLAGFVTPLGLWQQIEHDVDIFLKSHGVEILHTKDFHDGDPPFRRWTKAQRLSFANDLFKIVDARAAGISRSIQKARTIAFKKRTNSFQNTSPIGLCFGMVLAQIASVPLYKQTIRNQGLSFFVEAGNKNNAEIEKYFDAVSREPLFEGGLKSITFVTKASCRAIQLADFLAFYSRRQARSHGDTDTAMPLRHCPYVDTIKRYMPVWQQIAIGEPEAVGSLDTVRSLDDLSKFSRKSNP